MEGAREERWKGEEKVFCFEQIEDKESVVEGRSEAVI